MEEHLEDLSPEQIKERKLKIRKYVTIPLTIFLLIVLIIYLFPGDLVQVIESSFASEKLNNLEVEFQNGKVVFKEEVYQELLDFYLTNQRNEIKVCLLGKKNKNIYSINSLIKPKIIDSSVTHIQTTQCPKETLISLHSHPFKRCIFSEQDIKSYKHFKEINPISLMGVMCDVDQFGFYGELNNSN